MSEQRGVRAEIHEVDNSEGDQVTKAQSAVESAESEEKKEMRRKRNAIHSRKKRARKKAAERSLAEEHDRLSKQNKSLKIEHARLQHLMTRAVEILHFTNVQHMAVERSALAPVYTSLTVNPNPSFLPANWNGVYNANFLSRDPRSLLADERIASLSLSGWPAMTPGPILGAQASFRPSYLSRNPLVRQQPGANPRQDAARLPSIPLARPLAGRQQAASLSLPQLSGSSVLSGNGGVPTTGLLNGLSRVQGERRQTDGLMPPSFGHKRSQGKG